MKRGSFFLFLLILLGISGLAGSWNSHQPPSPAPTLAVFDPALNLGRETYDFSTKRPWLTLRQLDSPLDIQPEPDSISVSYTVHGEQVWQETLNNGDYLPLPEQGGITKITLKPHYEDIKSPLEKSLFVANPHESQIELNQTTFVPGELAIVHLSYLQRGQEVSASGNWFNISPQIFRQGDQGLILYPIPSSTQAGTYILEVQVENERTRQISLTIAPREFVMQPLTIDPDLNASTRNDNSYEEFGSMLAVARTTEEILPLFDSAFVLPLEGRMTTEYGQGRTINGVPSGSRHSGYDLAAPTGTEIQAPASGKVRFAGDMIMTGKTIVIEHGLGIFSQYYHMDSLAVQADDMVETGDILGAVGSTGFSTGPHLHFCIYVNGAYVDPAVFLDASIVDSLGLMDK